MRVIIADDHRIVREGLKLILAHDPSITITAEVGDGAELLHVLESTEADVVLLDVRMPNCSGLEVLERLQAAHTSVRVIVLSMYDDPAYVKRAIELGASGYLLKSASREELLGALHVVAAGGAYVQGDLTGPLIARIVSHMSDRMVADIDVDGRRLLELLVAGYDNREIAAELGVSEAAIKGRLHRLYSALGVRRRSEAVVVALRMGLVP
jgi:DNA-binding NarL/FixJ family response regulator